MLIELHCIGRWVIRLDFEGLVDRVGQTKAEIIWDACETTGEYKEGQDFIYIRSAVEA